MGRAVVQGDFGFGTIGQFAHNQVFDHYQALRATDACHFGQYLRHVFVVMECITGHDDIEGLGGERQLFRVSDQIA
jgi:hypothetical protein